MEGGLPFSPPCPALLSCSLQHLGDRDCLVYRPGRKPACQKSVLWGWHKASVQRLAREALQPAEAKGPAGTAPDSGGGGGGEPLGQLVGSHHAAPPCRATASCAAPAPAPAGPSGSRRAHQAGGKPGRGEARAPCQLGRGLAGGGKAAGGHRLRGRRRGPGGHYRGHARPPRAAPSREPERGRRPRPAGRGGRRAGARAVRRGGGGGRVIHERS